MTQPLADENLRRMRARARASAVLLLVVTGCGGSAESSSGGASGTGAAGTGGTSGAAAAAGSETTGGTGGLAAGNGGAAAGNSGTSSSLDVPTDTSADGIAAFLDAESYLSATWASNETAPVPPRDSSSPHGDEVIWYNRVLRQSKADGHAGYVGDTFGSGSMAVKELYTGTTRVGRAAILHADTKWILFCTATEPGRCFAGSSAGAVNYATGIGSCSCHGGGTVVTAERVPPP